MTDAPFEGQQFRTAAARRGGKILKLRIEHWQPPSDDDPDGEGQAITVTLRFDPLLDMLRMGTAFGQFGRTLAGFQTDETSVEDKMELLDREIPKMRAALRDCFVPPDRAKWDQVKEGVDAALLGELMRYLTRELSPVDPTQQASSSTGSEPTGGSSTDGAPLAV